MKNLFLLLFVAMFATTSFGQIKVTTSGNSVIGPNVSHPNPVDALTVKGSTWVDGNFLYVGQDKGWYINRSGSGSSKFVHEGVGQYQFKSVDAASVTFFTNDVSGFQLSATGNSRAFGGAFKPGGGPWAALSDKRSKKDINEFTDGIDELMQINPVSYKYIDKVHMGAGKDNNFVGVIAQEVEKVAPYMITTTELIKADGEVDTEAGDYLAVDPNAFTYMLINAVKEQQVMIQDQNERISQLEDMITSAGEAVNTTNVSLSSHTLASVNQNRPNPFTGSTTIDYVIPSDSETASINILSLDGKLMKTIDVEHVGEGLLNVDASNLASGTYTYQLVVDGRTVETHKMVVNN